MSMGPSPVYGGLNATNLSQTQRTIPTTRRQRRFEALALSKAPVPTVDDCIPRRNSTQQHTFHFEVDMPLTVR